MTTAGLILAPLCCLGILLPWRYVFSLLFVLMMLADIAVVIVGSYGVSPAFFFGNLMIARCALELVCGRQGLSQDVIGALLPLLFLFSLNIIVLWVAISVFQGEIEVITGMMGFNLSLAQPYHLVRENFTQIVYLAFHIVLIYAMGHQLMAIEPRIVARTLDRAVILAMLFAAAIIFWEMAGMYAGLTFPAWFFHSDTHSGAWGQVMVGTVLRASGSFPEPSAVGFTFAGFALYAWKRYKLGTGSTAFSMLLILICLVVLAASTATTAFAAMALFAVVAVKDTFGIHLRTAAARSGLRPMDLVALGLLGLGIAAAVLYVSANWLVIDEILTRMILEKNETGSYNARTSTDWMALDILIKTGGLGLGLGSHKPNSAVMTILSNTGILGFLAVALFFFMRLKPYGSHRYAPDPDSSLVAVPLQWLLTGFLFAHAISNPNVNHIGVWMVSGLLIGMMASLGRAASEASASLAPESVVEVAHLNRPRPSACT